MLIAQPDPILHMQQRKPWNRAFSSAAMKEYEIIVSMRVGQLVGCLEDIIERSDEKANVVVDMTQWMKYFRWVPVARTLISIDSEPSQHRFYGRHGVCLPVVL